MKIVFMGTPDFAVDSLSALAESCHEVLAVVTQPDKPSGRNNKIIQSPVKIFAMEHGMRVLQFEKISRDGADALRALDCDIMVTCAYGQILSREILDIAPHGIINVHASLLPKYRGAAPIQWSVISGDHETGVTIMQTEEGLDTGAVIHVEKTLIGENETSGELFDRLSKIGAKALLTALDKIESGRAIFEKQDDSLATRVKMLKKEDGKIAWSMTAEQVFNLVRGVNPWPGAYSYMNGDVIKIWSCKKVEINHRQPYAAGEIVDAATNCGIIVACGSGAVCLGEIQLPNAKRMDSREFLKGHKVKIGSRLGNNDD